MKLNLGLAALSPFDVDMDHASLGIRWKGWRERFDIYLDATGVTDDKQKRALLLHLAGEGVQRVFRGLSDTESDYKTATEKLDVYFLPKKNIRYERYVFKQAAQTHGESIDQFVTRLRALALTCSFENSDDAIADQLLEKCLSTSLKRRVLRDTESTLQSMLDQGRAMERADTQLQNMQITSREGVATLSRSKPRTYRYPVESMNRQAVRSDPVDSKTCFNCNGPWPHPDQRMGLARGKSCNKCGKLNHFAKCCRSKYGQTSEKTTANKHQARYGKPVHAVHNTSATSTDSSGSESEEGYVATLSKRNRQMDYVLAVNSKRPKTTVSISGVNIDMLVDSGASVNIVDAKHFAKIKHRNRNLDLQKSNARIYVYGSTDPLPVMGKFEAVAETKSRISVATFLVVDKAAGSLLGYSTAVDLGLISIPNINAVPMNDEHCGSSKKLDGLLSEYHDVFQGVGKLKDHKFRIYVDETIKPIVQPSRRVPFNIRNQTNAPSNKPEPFQMTELPSKPWSKVSTEFCGPLSSGEFILVLIDEYSGYPEIEIMKSMTPDTVIEKLDQIFATHGIVDELKTENGPAFNSVQFADYVKHMGFIHRKITPYWPKANTEAERFMRKLGKAIRTVNTEGNDLKKELPRFLLSYWATPHSTIGISPAELLFGRKIKTRLPEHNTIPMNDSVKIKDTRTKSRMKDYADKHTGAKQSRISKDDTVLVKQQMRNKLSTPFSIEPEVVVQKKGLMLIPCDAKREIHARNSSNVKKIPLTFPPDSHRDSEGSDWDSDTIAPEETTSPVQPQRYPSRTRYPPDYLQYYQSD